MQNETFIPFQELKDAGYDAKDFKNAKYPAQYLKNNGFSLKELMNAEYRSFDLKIAGYILEEIKECLTNHPNSYYNIQNIEQNYYTENVHN
ncbi:MULTISPECIES: hypothetical protein [16SrI (Aster yellows group)]|uniref:Uncharacterized protein n=2 Tax=16SrI (Aster yellows group) TaxID=3042590 RepID=A0A859I988_9MOLU|nr:hypothetical protein [Chrysanthemum yellows phytoplasma]QKX95028.1 MAG: hypothetical protein RP166_0070 [Rapeseed phyllody phytoplasma]